MKLYLLRHAKASQSSESGKDIDRPLSLKGVAQSNLIGNYFTNKDVFANVLCSSASRTKQTLDIVSYHKPMKHVTLKDDLYLCSRDQYLQILWDLSGSDDLMIVGHNFGISDLVTYLTDTRIELRTSEFVSIEFNGLGWKEISRGNGTIVDQYRPRIFVP